MTRSEKAPIRESGFFRFLSKIGNGIKWAYTGKFRWYFIIFSLFLLTYVTYLIFVLPYNNSTYSLDTAFGVNSYDLMKSVITTVAIISIVAVLCLLFFDLAKRRLTAGKAIVLIIALGIIMRLTYMVYSPIYFNYGTWKQHDLGYGGTTGHYSITMYMYRNLDVPDMIRNADGSVDFAASGQLYQPKLAHFIYALFMRFNSMFVRFGSDLAEFKRSNGTFYTMGNITKTEYALFEMTRIISCFSSIVSLLTLNQILKETKISEKSRAFAVILIAFCPVFYMFSTSVNNDPLSLMFGLLALLFAIRWMKNPRFVSIILTAVFLGLGMSCKLSIGFLALPIAIMFVYRFVKTIFAYKKGEIEAKEIKGKKVNPILLTVLMFAVFAVIVFPLGLSYSIYAKIRFDQPFNYVWLISKYNWNYVDDSVNPLWRYLFYPAPDFFKTIVVVNRAWTNGAVDPNIQPNLWSYVFKSSLFGEYSWNRYISPALYIFAFASMWIIFAFIIFLGIRAIKRKKADLLLFLLIGGLGVLYFFSAILFYHQYPFTCSMDFRYFVPLILVAAASVGRTFDCLDEYNGTLPKIIKGVTCFLLVGYAASSGLLYLIA